MDVLRGDIGRLEKSLGIAWEKVDDLRENAVRKAELKEYRAELKNDIKELGDRLERLIHDAIQNLRQPGGGN